MPECFADCINYWKHSGYWLFDSPEVIKKLTEEQALDLSETKFFYYEVYDIQFEDDKKEWQPYTSEASFIENLVVPKKKHLEGHDVVTFSVGSSPECSPLSCNSLASEITVNPHGLLATREEAKRSLDSGKFTSSELGPFRLLAVHSLKKY